MATLSTSSMPNVMVYYEESDHSVKHFELSGYAKQKLNAKFRQMPNYSQQVVDKLTKIEKMLLRKH